MKRFVLLFITLCMTLMLFDFPFDLGSVPVLAVDPAPHIHDMSVSCGGSGVEFQPYRGGSSKPGNYYLTENVSHVATWHMEEPGVYNLCLNGYSINPACIFIKENVTFNLCDCKGTGSITAFDKTNIHNGVIVVVHGEFNMYGGTLKGANDPDINDRGVQIDNDNGKFTMYSGEITGVRAWDTGGVLVLKGSFIMNGGKISNNTVSSSAAGAGVTAYGSTTSITINGGEISDNNGGFGVATRDGAKLEINGGKVINNRGGGGITCGGEAPYFSGSPVIKDNYDQNGEKRNLILSSGYNGRLYINGSIDIGTEIGIAECDSYIFTYNWNETMGDADPADYFTSDSDITKVKRYSDEGALCVLLTLDTGGLTGIVGDIPDPAYYPRFTEVELPKTLELKGHIFGGWSETPNRPLGSSSIELKNNTTLYPAFEACKHRSKGFVSQIDPTCTETGIEKCIRCDKCGMTFESWSSSEPFEPGILSALGHDFGDWTTVEEATCTADGKKERVCKRNMCGQKETDIISKTGHDFGTDYENDDTQHWQICAKCNAEGEKSDHTEDNGTVTVPATAENDGLKTFACSVCGYVMRTVTIPKLGEEHTHSFSTDWKHDSTSHWHECDCGEKSDIANHISSEWIVKVPATVEADGVKIKVCTVCGTELDRRAIDKLQDSGSIAEDVKDTAGTNARLVQDNTLIENVLTPNDKTEVTEGHSFEIVLEVTDIRNSVTAADVTAASSALRYNEKIGIYVDLSLFKIKDRAERTPIYNTSGHIGITLTVPYSIYASDRTYSIIRVHDGIAENLGGTYDRASRELTFYTDKFSTYAIAYASSNGGTDRPSVPSTPPTGGTTPVSPSVPVVTPTVTETIAKEEDEVISDEPYIEDVSSSAGIYENGEADNNIHYVMILFFAAAAGIAAIAAQKYFCKKNMK